MEEGERSAIETERDGGVEAANYFVGVEEPCFDDLRGGKGEEE